MPYPKMLSALIEELQDILDKNGDMPVCATGRSGLLTSAIEINTLPNWYDGGWLDPEFDLSGDIEYPCNWSRARINKQHDMAVEIMADEPSIFCHRSRPESMDRVDGQLLKKYYDSDTMQYYYPEQQ